MRRLYAGWVRRRQERVERRQLYRDRWDTLDPILCTGQQVAGTAAVSCGATHSIMEKCNFTCTSCYLSEEANYALPLPFAEVRAQLDELRAHLGAGGKAQITSGEVTLLPPAELGRIVAYARSIGLDPMVMTNGQRLLQVEGYLSTLVGEYGLEKISFHIDTTQQGRPGMPMGLEERDLHPLRERFAALVAAVRRQTGRRLHVAHTVTVTPQNLDGVADIARWMLDHAGSFRMISFLPVAEVGRTADRQGLVDMEVIWARVCAGLGRPLNRHAMHFGHPECNITVPLLVLRCGADREIVEAVREGAVWDLRIFRLVTREFSHHLEFDEGVLGNIWRLLGPCLRRPWRPAEFALYGLYRVWGARRFIMGALLKPRAWAAVTVRPLMVVVHRFMGAEELATELGRQRLEACVFKLPVDGRLVSMCEVNATQLRRQLNRRGVDRLAPSRRG